MDARKRPSDQLLCEGSVTLTDVKPPCKRKRVLCSIGFSFGESGGIKQEFAIEVVE